MLSDMNFAFLVIVLNYFIAEGIVNNRFNKLLIFLILFLMLITRPSSIPFIFAALIFLIFSKSKILHKPKEILIFLLILLILTPLLFATFYYLIEFKFSQIQHLKWLSSMVKDGMIIHDRPETWLNVPNNFFDVMNLYFSRLINFFNPYAETFSFIHIALNIILSGFIALSVFVWFIFGEKNILEHKMILFIIIMSFFTAAFHSFTLIDYDWRYRFPIIMPLIMIFPISLQMILKKKI